MMRFFHPQMIAQCANKPGPTIDQMIDFLFAGTGAAGTVGWMRRRLRCLAMTVKPRSPDGAKRNPG